MKKAMLFLLALPAFAQQPTKSIGQVTLFGEEPPKVEAATKTEIPISRAPASVTVITAKQIAESGLRSVPDLLRLVAGVNVRWNPMVTTIDVRGFGENPFSNRILLLVDGAPYNSGDTGGLPLSPAFDLFPVQNIKRIEVVRGPGSSLYGENAYWGVINIVTLSGEDLAGGNAEIYGGGVRDTTSVTAQYGKRFGDNSALASVKLLRSEFPTEFWMDDKSKYRASDVFLKGGHNDLQVSFYRHDDHLDGFVEHFDPAAGLPPGAAWASAHPLVQTLDVATLRYNHAPDGARFTYAADLSWAHRDGMHCAGCHAAPQKAEFQHRADHGYQAVADFRLGIHMLPGHDILVGTELRRLDRAEHKEELNQGTTNVVSGYDKVALYAQDQFSIVPDKLRAVVGLRYDRKTDLFESKTSPRVALVYTPNERLVLRGNYSTAFRFPTFSELYQASWFINAGPTTVPFPAFPLAVFQPNPNLVPEEIRTFEVGGEYQITPTLSARADIYRSRVKNFIVIAQTLGPGPPGLHFENHPADGNITGGEIELRANVTHAVTGFVNYAHESESQSGSGTDSDLRTMEFVYAPKHKLNVGGYAGPFNGVRGAVELSWRDKYVAPQFWYLVASNFTDPTVHPFHSYTLLNGRLSYDLPINRHVRVSVIGNNLLDKRQKETFLGADTRIVGREVFGQLEFHF